MKDIFEYHKKKINKQDKKYPLMEYFLSNKPIEKCSTQCQEHFKKNVALVRKLEDKFLDKREN